MLFPTSLVGSYPQPDWLIDRERPAPVPAPGRAASCGGLTRHTWRRRSGTPPCSPSGRRSSRLDILTDGEMCRESYSNRFATALDVSTSTIPPRPTAVATRRVPRVTGPTRAPRGRGGGRRSCARTPAEQSR
jgi:5-methyltetrahydropteroyltriglutamate--homocysteine methyltransferase